MSRKAASVNKLLLVPGEDNLVTLHSNVAHYHGIYVVFYLQNHEFIIE